MGETFLRCPLRTPRGRVLVSLPQGGEFLLGTPEFVNRASGESLRSFLASRIGEKLGGCVRPRHSPDLLMRG